MKNKRHLAYYGTRSIPRGKCPTCRTTAVVLENKFKCCGERVELGVISKLKRMSDVAVGRKVPTKARQIELLNEQDYRCFYCTRKFDSVVYRGSKAIKLKLHWDHQLPYAYSMSNRDSNFVAACHVCNGIKSSFVYRTIEEARIDITERWCAKGYSDEIVCSLRIKLSPETPVAKVL